MESLGPLFFTKTLKKNFLLPGTHPAEAEIPPQSFPPSESEPASNKSHIPSSFVEWYLKASAAPYPPSPSQHQQGILKTLLQRRRQFADLAAKHFGMSETFFLQDFFPFYVQFLKKQRKSLHPRQIHFVALHEEWAHVFFFQLLASFMDPNDYGCVVLPPGLYPLQDFLQASFGSLISDKLYFTDIQQGNRIKETFPLHIGIPQYPNQQIIAFSPRMREREMKYWIRLLAPVKFLHHNFTSFQIPAVLVPKHHKEFFKKYLAAEIKNLLGNSELARLNHPKISQIKGQQTFQSQHQYFLDLQSSGAQLEFGGTFEPASSIQTPTLLSDAPWNHPFWQTPYSGLTLLLQTYQQDITHALSPLKPFQRGRRGWDLTLLGSFSQQDYRAVHGKWGIQRVEKLTRPFFASRLSLGSFGL